MPKSNKTNSSQAWTAAACIFVKKCMNYLFIWKYTSWKNPFLFSHNGGWGW